MDKKVKLSICIFVLLLCAAVSVGCAKKKQPVSVETFTSEMSRLDFSVDATANMEGISDYVKQVTSVKSKNKTTLILYSSATEEDAITAYLALHNSIDAIIQKSNLDNSIETPHYQKYIAQSQTMYAMVERIDDTVLLAFCNIQYIEELKNALQEIGY